MTLTCHMCGAEIKEGSKYIPFHIAIGNHAGKGTEVVHFDPLECMQSNKKLRDSDRYYTANR